MKYIYKNNFRAILLLFILFASWAAMQVVEKNAVKAEEMQKGIANEIIRFHVIANSDSKADQALKYLVRDALVKELTPYLKDAQDITTAREIISSNISVIKKTAENTIKSCGYSYDVAVALKPCYFPLKIYGDYTFPPGTYDALRVQIGEAAGENWWCVMFPPLCFVDETYSIVDEESQKKLKYLLTEEEYNSLVSQKTPVKIKFKLFEAFKKLFTD